MHSDCVDGNNQRKIVGNALVAIIEGIMREKTTRSVSKKSNTNWPYRWLCPVQIHSRRLTYFTPFVSSVEIYLQILRLHIAHRVDERPRGGRSRTGWFQIDARCPPLDRRARMFTLLAALMTRNGRARVVATNLLHFMDWAHAAVNVPSTWCSCQPIAIFETSPGGGPADTWPRWTTAPQVCL